MSYNQEKPLWYLVTHIRGGVTDISKALDPQGEKENQECDEIEVEVSDSYHSYHLKSRDLERHYNQMSPPTATAHKIFLS